MIRITHDVFDIGDRIKSIDSRYELFYNRKSRRYEVYIGDTLESVIPYDSLDYRTLDYLRMTRRENMQALIESIEENNEKIEKENEYEIRRRAENRIEEVLR